MKQLIAGLLAASLLLCCGCSLAKPHEELQSSLPTEDSLIGVLLTTEYLDLFDTEAWLNDNLNTIAKGGDVVFEGDTSQYQGRIYAEQTEEIWYSDNGKAHTSVSYKFPEELKGYALIAPMVTDSDGEQYRNTINGAIFSGTSAHIISTDAGDAVELTATVYYDPLTIPKEAFTELQEDTFRVCFYHNPVYQTPEGDVYVTSGSGSAYSAGPGVGYYGQQGTHTLSQIVSTTVDGETEELKSSVKITTHAVRYAEKIVVNEMSERNKLLRTVEYSHTDIPRELTVGSDAAYAIIETHSVDDNGAPFISRQIATADNQEESFTVFVPIENGYAAKQETKVVRE